ncbi:MAG: NUDIX domain-containing protein [Nitriliruptoraceae bacterium]
MQPRIGTGRPRYARTVTAENIADRVSVRHYVDDPERGPVPTDAVGRLVAFDDDVLVIIDRHRDLHIIARQHVLAAKPIPEHPRRAPEPAVPTRETPFEREAARVLLLDNSGRVALVAHHPTAATTVWTAPGGGRHADETVEEAARRELREELGIEATPGPVVLERTATFAFHSVWITQHENWVLVRLDDVLPGIDRAHAIDDAPLGDAAISSVRWWSADELAATTEHVEPPDLAEIVAALHRDGAPATPWQRVQDLRR